MAVPSSTTALLKTAVEQSIAALGGLLLVSPTTQCSTHSLIGTAGLSREPTLVAHLAVYLTGAIASCIEWNLEIRHALFDDNTLGQDLRNNVAQVIGSANTISDDRKRTERNPWIWEGISHLLVHLSRGSPNRHPPGRILAKTMIHLDAKDHGLDLVALYQSPTALGITAGECKAYLKRPDAAIRDAAATLRQLDTDRRDGEVRAAVTTMSPALSPEERKNLVGSFWKRERCYLPLVCCDSKSAIDWTSDRPSLQTLAPPLDRKFLIPACIDDAESFFDEVADAMRSFAASIK